MIFDAMFVVDGKFIRPNQNKSLNTEKPPEIKASFIQYDNYGKLCYQRSKTKLVFAEIKRIHHLSHGPFFLHRNGSDRERQIETTDGQLQEPDKIQKNIFVSYT